MTEEVWSWWREGSVHRAAWPTADDVLREIGGTPDAAGALALERAALVLSEVRRTKSEAKRPLTTPVVQVTVHDTSDHLASLRTSEADVRAAGFVELLTLLESDAFSVSVELSPAEAKL